MKYFTIYLFLLSCALQVKCQILKDGKSSSEAEKSSMPITTTTVRTTLQTTTPQIIINCLNNDCNSDGGPKIQTTQKPSGGIIAANMINDEDVTSVPRKGVDQIEDDLPPVPRKGVNSLHQIQSSKKELKDVGSQEANTKLPTSTTVASTTPPTKTTGIPTTTSRNQSQNLNMVSTKPVVKGTPPHSKPNVTVDELDLTSAKQDVGSSGTSLVVGLVCALLLMTVLLFVGLKRIESIRRRREYRRMNDFLIDGMYNDL